ncbi:MAG: hypothetical protein AB1659_07410, partial [Thermodesulfobacteriota bacterium]
SHLFPNELLQTLFGNLPRMFFLQDQYALLGLLFYIATGKTLFENTGRLLPEIVMAAQKTRLKNQTPADLFKHASWVFWNSAVQEYQGKLAMHQKILNTQVIRIPENAAQLLKEEIVVTQKDLLDRIHFLLNSQHTLNNSSIIDALNRASGSAIRRQREKIEKEEDPDADPELRERKIQFLSTLENLKTTRETIDRIKADFPTLRFDDLLTLLFCIILGFMYRENWIDRIPPILPAADSTPVKFLHPDRE